MYTKFLSCTNDSCLLYKDQMKWMKCFCAIGADQYTIVPSITPFIEVDQSVSLMLLMVELV